MKELVLDSFGWNSRDDLYDAFFTAVGAPAWHGRNFDALNDSIATGQINRIEIPYRIVIRNFDKLGPGARQIANDFVLLIREIAARGCQVEIRTENS